MNICWGCVCVTSEKLVSDQPLFFIWVDTLISWMIEQSRTIQRINLFAQCSFFSESNWCLIFWMATLWRTHFITISSKHFVVQFHVLYHVRPLSDIWCLKTCWKVLIFRKLVEFLYQQPFFILRVKFTRRKVWWECLVDIIFSFV